MGIFKVALGTNIRPLFSGHKLYLYCETSNMWKRANWASKSPRPAAAPPPSLWRPDRGQPGPSASPGARTSPRTLPPLRAIRWSVFAHQVDSPGTRGNAVSFPSPITAFCFAAWRGVGEASLGAVRGPSAPTNGFVRNSSRRYYKAVFLYLCRLESPTLFHDINFIRCSHCQLLSRCLPHQHPLLSPLYLIITSTPSVSFSRLSTKPRVYAFLEYSFTKRRGVKD